MSARFLMRMIARLAFFPPGAAAAGIALIGALAIGVFADHQNRAIHHQSARTEVSEQLGAIRASLEGNITSNIQLVRGLTAVIASQPDIDQDRFSRIASNLVGHHSQLRNIAGAPNLVVSLMYPIEGNEKAIGLDYRNNAVQREAALRAVASKEMVLAGPVDLLQGGQGFIGRFPVFIDDEFHGRHLWGIVSAVVDVERLYADSGLLADDLPIEIAISGRDATGAAGAVFFGRSRLLDSDPVVSEVTLPSGSWRLAAIPRGGWSDSSADVWVFRFYIVVAALLLIAPISIAGYLFDQRRKDIRNLRRSQRLAQKLSQRLTLALNTSRIGVWELTLDSGILTWDSRMRELYSLPDDVTRIDVEHWRRALHPDDRDRAEREFTEAIGNGTTYESEFRVRDGQGATRWIRAIAAIHDGDFGQRYMIGANWDVSADFELKASLVLAKQNAELRNLDLECARTEMEHNSLHDSLTGLPNRRFLDDRLLSGAAGHQVTALLHIDLDRFKQINDTLGHAAGDAMLVHAASVLRGSVRQGDIIARVGGDEFVIAITQPTDEAQLAALAGRIVDEMRQPVPYQNHQCRFGVSIGIAMADCNEAEPCKPLLVDADIALYRAKKNGRNRFEFFNESLKTGIIRSKRLADDILSGLERQEFLPHFQPQFDARTLDIVGVEALARWEHPTEGLLTPDAFLPTAEELDVVPMIDQIILKQTLWQSTRWKALNLHIPKMSVNVSAGRLYDPNLIDGLDGLAFEPGTLSFELLESIFLDDNNETIVDNIARLKQLGIEIEIDDFGTGFASIVSLIQVRPTTLKIDRCLIQPIVGCESQRRLVASIIDIGQSLGIKVVAEGVETMEHAAILRELGCDTLQGYAFAAPMSSDRLIEFVRRQHWRAVA
ncbi:periplasmic sensor diguanylate cyclase/phosphodiesterase [Hoeflea marina]|uniref:Periplasmic sensor diguanylate cyclase/phosphodiesterase n=1 Tax=Hoeflea marina TaxID=274592 RepID=A0A317PJ71_9HYPH|nr:EAL domain-containing protein [Hoeflea marina]PWV99915.1 periplasmic sensor diguanylate cyclase/phosphodiesterase [Hoeflea marina]